jgi:hypothetical protein
MVWLNLKDAKSAKDAKRAKVDRDEIVYDGLHCLIAVRPVMPRDQ